MTLDLYMITFQDYMLFDPFIYHGIAETYDRHRDMRLDVDNMSYEVKRDCCFIFNHFTWEFILLTLQIDR